MKLYRVSMRAKEGSPNSCEHVGYEHLSSKRAADLFVRKHSDNHDCTIRKIELTPSKRGIIRALNEFGGHADNG